MHEVLPCVRELLRGRAVRAWWLALALLGLAATTLPLCALPGYELAEALTLLLGLPGGGLAIALGRRARAGRPAEITAAALVLASTTLPALCFATLRTSLTSPCDPFAAWPFVPVLVLPTATLAAALGLLLGRLRRWWLAASAWAGVVLLAAVGTVWPIVAGPQVFAFHHLAGYLPGPLYDEELRVTAAVLWFRLATLLLAAGLAALHARRPGLATLALVGALALEWQGPTLGFRATDESVARALGGRVEVDELVLHHPAAWTDEELSRALGDLRFRYHQLVEFFGAAPEGKVRVWWYPSAEAKQRLVGAAHTQFAKPWRREVHVNGRAFPHPVIKHELVHALAAPWGAPPFGVTASLGGLVPHVGLIEGFAVAADDPIDELTLHEWAAAMKQQGLLPDVRSLMTPGGFYGAPPSRAYATAGSFLRFVADRYGKEALRTLYRASDFVAATGQPLEALIAAYEAFLETVPLEPGAVTQAFARFKRGSVFERPCAREVARLSTEAGRASSPDEALTLLARCRALQPGEPAHALAEAEHLRRAGLLGAARELLDLELVRLEDTPGPWADAALARADLAHEAGDFDTARALWRRVLERAPTPAVDRTAHVRLEALDLPPPARDAVGRLFTPGNEDVKLFLLSQAREVAPDSAALRYLLARRLALAGEFRAALPLLVALHEVPLPDSIARETARLLLEAAFAQGDCRLVERLAGASRFGPAFSARARDWLARCRFAYPGTGPAN
jgi:tetratricopeptide (TPR) repeat protein